MLIGRYGRVDLMLVDDLGYLELDRHGAELLFQVLSPNGRNAQPWETALSCPRQPANRRCPGRIIVLRTEPPAPIRWQCSLCPDQGLITNWADSPYDLRPRRLTLTDPVNQIIINHEVAAVLRELRLVDADCERLVFRIRAHHDGAVLPTTDDDLEELIGFVAAEANHESNQRRQRRLDTAFSTLSNQAHASGDR